MFPVLSWSWLVARAIKGVYFTWFCSTDRIRISSLGQRWEWLEVFDCQTHQVKTQLGSDSTRGFKLGKAEIGLVQPGEEKGLERP